MASSSLRLPPNSLGDTLAYFARYDYPLTADELWFWQHGTRFSKLKIKELFVNCKLKIENSDIRKHREAISRKKWLIAKKAGEQLSKIKSVEAIFVTGTLAMDNCTAEDDVDLMIVTLPHALWLTRLLVYLKIRPFRRKPGVTNAPDKICDNLYLDIKNLKLKIKNLRVAHEVLQAKCIYDRGGIHKLFLESNPWVEKYLPIAYRESFKNLKLSNLKLTKNFKFQISNLLYPINLLLFVIQYLYMKPKMTIERVSLGYAFFHPEK